MNLEISFNNSTSNQSLFFTEEGRNKLKEILSLLQSDQNKEVQCRLHINTKLNGNEIRRLILDIQNMPEVRTIIHLNWAVLNENIHGQLKDLAVETVLNLHSENLNTPGDEFEKKRKLISALGDVKFQVDTNVKENNTQFLAKLSTWGVSSDALKTTEIPFYTPDSNAKYYSPPAYIDNNNFTCEYYENTISLDASGDLLLCTAHEKGIVNLMDVSVSELIKYKGSQRRVVGKNQTCVSCIALARFTHQDSKVGPEITQLLDEGQNWKGHLLWKTFQPHQISHQADVCSLSEQELEQVLADFTKRLNDWAAKVSTVREEDMQSRISVECPVFKSSWFLPCLESVLYQTSLQWTLYLVWDGGDEISKRILEIIDALNHPKLKVFFTENRGIARARNFLSSKGIEDYIMPLDDDDMLDCRAVEKYIEQADSRPWFGVIRGLRRFINESGELLDMDEWFPFEPRKYQHGMVQDLNNHCQPYLISRQAYLKTDGWEGFPHFHYAGEDCDIYLKAEEKGAVELIDDLLYYYRLNPKRTSHILKPEGAYEMWRLLADKTIKRIGLPLERLNDKPPFLYQKLENPKPSLKDVDFVIPYYETNETELNYAYKRPDSGFTNQFWELNGRVAFEQDLLEDMWPLNRVELVLSAKKPVNGFIEVTVFNRDTDEIIGIGKTELEDFQHYTKNVSVIVNEELRTVSGPYRIRVAFVPKRITYNTVRVLLAKSSQGQFLLMRMFRTTPGSGKKLLNLCLDSLKKNNVSQDSIHIISKRQSSAKNRNDGFAMTKKPYVCFLDDDVELYGTGSVEELLELMHHTGAELIGPKLLTNDNKIFCARPWFNKLGRPVPSGLGEKDEGQYDFNEVVPWLPTTMLLVKREVFKAIGGFDEGYIGSQMEDVDFCLKARRRDFVCLYAGTVAAIHHNNQRNDRFSENFRAFNARWKNYSALWIDEKVESEFL